MYKETAQKVDLIALEKLCVLFNCQVGDLLEWTSTNTPPCEINN
jgi:putative transcriptional regulator